MDATPDDNFYVLWLTVTMDAVITLQTWPNNTPSHDFIFDQNNPFFDYVAERLGFEPDILREHILASIQAAKQRSRMPYKRRSLVNEGDALAGNIQDIDFREHR